MISKKDRLDAIIGSLSEQVPFLEVVFRELEIVKGLPVIQSPDTMFLTDGVALYVNEELEQQPEEENEELKQELMHELLHVYLGHPVMANPGIRMQHDVESDAEVNPWISTVFGPEAEERYPSSREMLPENNSKHFLWYIPNPGGSGENPSEDDQSEDDQVQTGKKASEVWNRIQMQLNGRTAADSQDTMSEPGENAGNGVGNHASVHVEEKKEEVPYTDILMRYAVIKEESCDTDEAMDIVMYTYGLDLYGNIPLVEPPEETDVLTLQVVIAIDTSGSCQCTLVEKFLRQIKTALSYITQERKQRIDVFLLLCDNELQQEFHIKDLEEFPSWEDFVISGGGTDFTPVFQRVEELIREKKIEGDTALFYYSDGWGSFPESSPSFDSYFILEKEDMDTPCIPDWVNKIEMR